MPLASRNPSIEVESPVEEWDFDTLLAAVEDGTSVDWNRLAMAVEEDPNGTLARDLNDVILAAEDSRLTRLFGRIHRSAVLYGQREAPLYG